MTLLQGGGAIPDAEGFAYIHRSFEDEVFQFLSAGSWVVLLGPRQHGKTSGLVRVTHRLQHGGIPTAFVDIQAFGNTTAIYDDFLSWISNRMAEAYGSEKPKVPEDTADLADWVAGCLPPGRGTVSLILDEAAAIPEAHRARFFSQMRALFNSRAANGADSIGTRLVVAFCGTFDPDELITGDNSPFNICERIESKDLTDQDVTQLAVSSLGEEVGTVAGPQIFDVSGGQPYLCQTALLCIQRSSIGDVEQALDDFKQRHLTGRDGHLPTLLGQFATDASAIRILRLLAQGMPVSFNPMDGLHTRLRIAGLCLVRGQVFEIRNRLYGEFVRGIPTIASEDGAATATALLLGQASFAKLANPALRELASDFYEVGFYLLSRRTSKRMALSAFGACLEAILLDYALRFQGPELINARAAITQAPNVQAASSNVEGWSLNQLVEGVLAVHPIGGSALAGHAVRGWRNLIHPANAMKQMAPADGFEPEAQIVAHWIIIVLRDLP